MIAIEFRHCRFEWDETRRKSIVYFSDGTEAHAIPHDTNAYHQHAREKSTGIVDLYCWQHDVAHQIAAMMQGRVVSLVLWNLAHGLPTNTPDCDKEELMAQQFQRSFFLRETQESF